MSWQLVTSRSQSRLGLTTSCLGLVSDTVSNVLVSSRSRPKRSGFCLLCSSPFRGNVLHTCPKQDENRHFQASQLMVAAWSATHLINPALPRPRLWRCWAVIMSLFHVQPPMMHWRSFRMLLCTQCAILGPFCTANRNDPSQSRHWVLITVSNHWLLQLVSDNQWFEHQLTDNRFGYREITDNCWRGR